MKPVMRTGYKWSATAWTAITVFWRQRLKFPEFATLNSMSLNTSYWLMLFCVLSRSFCTPLVWLILIEGQFQPLRNPFHFVCTIDTNLGVLSVCVINVCIVRIWMPIPVFLLFRFWMPQTYWLFISIRAIFHNR